MVIRFRKTQNLLGIFNKWRTYIFYIKFAGKPLKYNNVEVYNLSSVYYILSRLGSCDSMETGYITCKSRGDIKHLSAAYTRALPPTADLPVPPSSQTFTRSICKPVIKMALLRVL